MLKLANNASSTLAAAIEDSDTTVTVAVDDADRFPSLGAGDWFPAILEWGTDFEIVRVTARAGATMTVVRAQEGTSAPPLFPAGTRLDLRMTAAIVQHLADDVLQRLGVTSFTVSPDPPAGGSDGDVWLQVSGS